MTIRIEITQVQCQRVVEGNYLQVALAPEGDDPSIYVLFQRALDPDEQDKELGHDRCYVEVGSTDAIGYGISEEVVWKGDRVSIRFSPERGLEDLELILGSATYSADELKDYLRRIVGEQFRDLTDVAEDPS